MINTWPSPAKINLFLYVTGIRSDGYHYIQSLFQFLNYGDTLTIIPNTKGTIELFTESNSLVNIKNSIITAAELLKEKALHSLGKKTSHFGAKIFLNKKIPIGSGLGGGSSNAATTLVVLNNLWKTKFTLQELAELSLKIGSDIPAFIMGKTTIVEGIGEILYPIHRKEKWYLIVYPNISISTKNIFSIYSIKKNTIKKPIDFLLRSRFHNDFENVIKKKFKKIKQLISMLSLYAPSRITGTGSCIFAEFNDKKSAQKIHSLLPHNVQGTIVKSVNVSPLHHAFYKKNINLFN
ncbi:4-(cytidine 5'-diphospho)-2-C-methyl-D-erythritol kinase [Buchnera aphidicola]|jgi:4-diphosphocytidyl-2-C-methyl-D-erythritol kinase|uniref:4-diphosphocytidyl-2-C-methyl-D-erythritol kinase n=1 Tax=Buchnera aphidicola subsp. Schizaphis graminum (strain Sg) TaxID=198804 RepID=ISPE_BUCAP|nr:4-(cytidine 5'-diphospho)-2-C-methyl-D-erythritol kinase [Buchnera aphidicola]Q8K9X1.1 RecName: Full=4-diphosphocytidyl-2-C-methyl-D-erythritol kinase; Short=CMK; AltName: Full=4-(cytidine-5'-diphospho)-2-C-methyl-D-erythritol kinase [Buchnera aphidicola str. Sg (Schizaphis graminum)]AAM67731.1 isopentenyl monophosphate kinase [Buchnera aphidicola str. Sg (Schizaphis graminum)]AWI49771.1 4-(cytidine 5'-diphospho)-2-C-methyl-D-erythritol kinase [Buchnera aphidicola (Schizaphis graminum)]